MSDLESPRAAGGAASKRRIPAWVLFLVAAVLAFVFLIAWAGVMAHVHEGGSPVAYAAPFAVGAAALLAWGGGYSRLSAGRGRRGRALALFVMGVVVLAFVGAITDGIGNDPGGVRFGLPFAVAVLTFGLALSIYLWRGLDEAAREAHKWASYWGASGGIAVAMPLFLFPDSERLRTAVGLGDTFAEGAWTLVLLQLAGYGLAWGAWWLRRR